MAKIPPALAIHAHCYQPDRRDPFSGRIAAEPAAAPFHDFNRKITSECYRPNAELGNFDAVSFDFGPTLAGWLAKSEPAVWSRIVAAHEPPSSSHASGHALASGFHHTILPLASRADKELQVAWGIADYEHRFGRRPRGFWLPETAADLETLAVLAEQGIEYTILAPWQAADEEGLDVTRPHWIELPGGRRIAAFFFHRALSGALSFDPKATADAERFAARLAAELPTPDDPEEARLLLLASDGELYGHHQKFRDLFLTRLLGGAAQEAGFTVSTPELFLAEHPPRSRVGLRLPSSWSCHHGVARWQGECPCTPGAAWKAQLRTALDRLAESLDHAYYAFAEPHVTDPWALRAQWIEVLLERRPSHEVLAQAAPRPLTTLRAHQLETLLKAQVQRQRMFTSCGWFFSDSKGLEPGYILAAAAAAISLTRAVTGEDPEPATLARLQSPEGEPLAATLRAALRAADELVRV
jgi:alpha-amylase/alpha-mannosidase (GH57 family)